MKTKAHVKDGKRRARGVLRAAGTLMLVGGIFASEFVSWQRLARLESVALASQGSLVYLREPSLQRAWELPDLEEVEDPASETHAAPVSSDNGEDPDVDSDVYDSHSDGKKEVTFDSKKDLGTVETRGFVAVFLHIHKGGGTTMCAMARKKERPFPDANCNVDNREDRLKLCNGTPQEFEAVVDKFRKEDNLTFFASEWVLPEKLPDRPDIKYITMLRNPLARMESHFHMAFGQGAKLVKNSPKKAKCRFNSKFPTTSSILRRVDKDLDIASATREVFALHTPDNWQTRAVCGPACAGVSFGQLTDEHFEIARRRLEEDFSVVGIIEHFQETVTLFHDMLKWSGNSSEFFAEHHGTNHSGLSVLEKIESNSAESPRLLSFARWWHAVNQYDIKLYNTGRKAFQKQAAAAGLDVDMGPDLSADFVTPKGDVTNAEDLQIMLSTYTASQKCSTQCCSARCAPIGRFWRSTALGLGMLPQGRC